MEAVVRKEGSLPEGPSADSPAPRLRIGDHLVSARRFTSHHGIYLGNGQVIHYAGLASGLQAGPVKVSSLAACRTRVSGVDGPRSVRGIGTSAPLSAPFWRCGRADAPAELAAQATQRG